MPDLMSEQKNLNFINFYLFYLFFFYFSQSAKKTFSFIHYTLRKKLFRRKSRKSKF